MTYVFTFMAGYVCCLMQSYIYGWVKAGWAKLTGNLPPPPAS